MHGLKIFCVFKRHTYDILCSHRIRTPNLLFHWHHHRWHCSSQTFYRKMVQCNQLHHITHHVQSLNFCRLVSSALTTLRAYFLFFRSYVDVKSTLCTTFQITQSHVVKRLLLHYKTDLLKVVKELRMPYNIEVLTQIRHDCYQHNFSNPNSLQNTQVLVSCIRVSLYIIIRKKFRFILKNIPTKALKSVFFFFFSFVPFT